jgi:hypothetical protein
MDKLSDLAKKLAPYLRQTRPIPLTTRLTSTSWDGDLYPTTSKTLIDLSAVFGAPAGIKMVLFRYTIYDAGSAATDCILVLSPENTSGVGPQVNCERVNSAPRRGELLVPCDTNGDVYFQCTASGGATPSLSVRLEIWTYWI